MHPPQDHPARNASAAEAARTERLYEKCAGVLKQTLEMSFGVPPDEAEMMVQHALLALITTNVVDEEAWVIAAVCRLGTQYQAAHELKIPPDARPAEVRAIRERMIVRDAIATLPDRAQEALRLRFVEGRTMAEVAEQLDINMRFAKRLVLGSVSTLLRRVRARR